MYLDEFNDDVIGNLLNRQEGDTDGEVKTVAKHVATDYAFSADPDDPLITRYSIWHKPLQANAANEPCDADGEQFQEMCSIVLDRPIGSEWFFHADGYIQADISSVLYNAKIGNAGAAFPLSTTTFAVPQGGNDGSYYGTISTTASYTQLADSEEVFLYIGKPGTSSEIATFRGRLFGLCTKPAMP